MGGGRSYEFDPETGDEKSYSRSVLRDNKEKVAKDEPPLPAGEKISYGRKFAQTEEMYTVRQMNQELEELARADGRLDEGPAKEADKARKVEVKAELPPPPAEVSRGAPIGSLPPGEEPPPTQRFSDVIDDAQQYLMMIQRGIRDIVRATGRLARLPLDVASLAAHRIRPLKA